MGYPCDPQDVWEEGISDCISAVKQHGEAILQEEIYEDNKALLYHYLEELIKRLNVNVFP